MGSQLPGAQGRVVSLPESRIFDRLAQQIPYYGEVIGANAASEPDAGSDIFAMRTRAVRQGDSYVLNGAKTFVSNAGVADLVVAYATLDPALGPKGVTAFLVERDTPGLTISRKLEKMGLRTSPMAEVVFDDCRVPVSNRFGRKDAEWRYSRVLWSGSEAAFWPTASASCVASWKKPFRMLRSAVSLANHWKIPVCRQPHCRHEGPVG
jgi:hypothetical protein